MAVWHLLYWLCDMYDNDLYFDLIFLLLEIRLWLHGKFALKEMCNTVL